MTETEEKKADSAWSQTYITQQYPQPFKLTHVTHTQSHDGMVTEVNDGELGKEVPYDPTIMYYQGGEKSFEKYTPLDINLARVECVYTNLDLTVQPVSEDVHEPGTWVFGSYVEKIVHTPDISVHKCELMVELKNKNGDRQTEYGTVELLDEDVHLLGTKVDYDLCCDSLQCCTIKIPNAIMYDCCSQYKMKVKVLGPREITIISSANAGEGVKVSAKTVDRMVAVVHGTDGEKDFLTTIAITKDVQKLIGEQLQDEVLTKKEVMERKIKAYMTYRKTLGDVTIDEAMRKVRSVEFGYKKVKQSNKMRCSIMLTGGGHRYNLLVRNIETMLKSHQFLSRDRVQDHAVAATSFLETDEDGAIVAPMHASSYIIPYSLIFVEGLTDANIDSKFPVWTNTAVNGEAVLLEKPNLAVLSVAIHMKNLRGILNNSDHVYSAFTDEKKLLEKELKDEKDGKDIDIECCEQNDAATLLTAPM